MQSPTIVFDHIKKTVTTVQPGPVKDKRLAEALAPQPDLRATSGRPAT